MLSHAWEPVYYQELPTCHPKSQRIYLKDANTIIKEPHSLASFSIAQLLVLACGERETTGLALPPACNSTVAPCLYDQLAFLQRHSSLWISSLLSPWTISLQSTAVLDLGLLSSLHAPAPSHLVFWWNSPFPGYVRLWHGLCGSHSIWTVTE